MTRATLAPTASDPNRYDDVEWPAEPNCALPKAQYIYTTPAVAVVRISFALEHLWGPIQGANLAKLSDRRRLLLSPKVIPEDWRYYAPLSARLEERLESS